jgi:hypothetical protein
LVYNPLDYIRGLKIMDVGKKLMLAFSLLSIIALCLCFASLGLGNWFPPGGGIVP